MLKPSRMVHVEILLAKNHLLPVSEFLGQRGILHTTRSSRRGGTAPAAGREDSKALDAYRKLSERLTKLFTFFELEPPAARPVDREHTHVSRDWARLDQELERLEHEAEDIEAALALLTEENSRMALLQEQIEPIEFLDANLTMLHEFKHMASFLGTIPNDILPRLRKGLSGYNAIIVPLKTIGKSTVIMAFAASSHDDVLNHALRSAFFKEIAIPARLKGTPKKILQTINVIAGENAEGIEVLDQEKVMLAEKREDRLGELWFQVQDNLRTFEVIGLFLKTREAYLVTGWLPEEQLAEFEKEIDGLTDNRALITYTNPSENDRTVPTRLENPRIVSAFETLTETYGMPSYEERDPTIFLAFSSLLMFGAMFADVGHGLMLAIIGSLVIYLSDKSNKTYRHIGLVIILFGLSATVFGVLFGSIFGKEDLFKPLWLSPMHSIMPLFKYSCMFGAALVVLGLLINIQNLISRRQWDKALCDKYGIAGLVFYGAFLWLGVILIEEGVSGVTFLQKTLLTVPLVLIGGHGLLLKLLGDEHHQRESVWQHLIDGSVEILETFLTYFSNTLSFVRIGAFALCHAGLCQTVYVIAGDVAGGGVIGFIVALLGNLFIVLFEGLIVSIQTMRLEYYEFFSKFFRSGGVPYRPFALEQGEKR